MSSIAISSVGSSNHSARRVAIHSRTSACGPIGLLSALRKAGPASVRIRTGRVLVPYWASRRWKEVGGQGIVGSNAIQASQRRTTYRSPALRSQPPTPTACEMVARVASAPGGARSRPTRRLITRRPRTEASAARACGNRSPSLRAGSIARRLWTLARRRHSGVGTGVISASAPRKALMSFPTTSPVRQSMSSGRCSGNRSAKAPKLNSGS